MDTNNKNKIIFELDSGKIIDLLETKFKTNGENNIIKL